MAGIFKSAKKFVMTAILASACVSSFARGKQMLIKAGSWVYDALAQISLEGGYTDFSLRAPLSIEEIEFYLSKADYDSLSVPGQKQYDRIKRYFEEESKVSFGSDILKIQAEGTVALEGYYKTNEDIDWVYDDYKRNPVLFLPVSINVADYATMYMELIGGQNRGTMHKHDNYLNVPLGGDDVDLNFPTTAYFSAGHKITENTGFNFQIAMARTAFNRSLSGSIVQSEYLSGSTWMELSFYSPNFRYKANINHFNVNKFLYTHEMSFVFLKKLQFTARESLMVFSPLELRFMNPFGIYHGFSPWRNYGSNESNTCDYLGLRLEYTPYKYMRFYGLFAMTQFQTPFETSNNPDDNTPNGLGFQLGGESFIPAGDGYIHLWAEGTYTQPYLYIKESPNWSMIRKTTENMGPEKEEGILEWLGTPWGPDTVGCEVSVGYEVPQKWSVTFDYVFKACGELSGNKVFKRPSTIEYWDQETYPDISVDKAAEDAWVFPTDSNGYGNASNWTTPHGTPEYVNRIALRATYNPVERLTLVLQPSYTFISNFRNVSGEKEGCFEIAIAASMKLF